MILLDTRVWLWMVSSPGKLSRAAVREIRKAQREGGCAIASIGLWELALLFAKGTLRASGTVEASIREIDESAAAHVLEITPDVPGLATDFRNPIPRMPAIA